MADNGFKESAEIFDLSQPILRHQVASHLFADGLLILMT